VEADKDIFRMLCRAARPKSRLPAAVR
jgi:hypothetical protein